MKRRRGGFKLKNEKKDLFEGEKKEVRYFAIRPGGGGEP